MKEETFDNVWDAIEDDPAVAENLKLRSLLMIELERHIKREKWTQAKAAKLLGVTQPRISDLMRGKIGMFSIDTLVTMLAVAGIGVDIRGRPVRVQTPKVPASQAAPKTSRRRVAA